MLVLVPVEEAKACRRRHLALHLVLDLVVQVVPDVAHPPLCHRHLWKRRQRRNHRHEHLRRSSRTKLTRFLRRRQCSLSFHCPSFLRSVRHCRIRSPLQGWGHSSARFQALRSFRLSFSCSLQHCIQLLISCRLLRSCSSPSHRRRCHGLGS